MMIKCVSLQYQSLSVVLVFSNSCNYYDQLVPEYLSYTTEKQAIVNLLS